MLFRVVWLCNFNHRNHPRAAIGNPQVLPRGGVSGGMGVRSEITESLLAIVQGVEPNNRSPRCKDPSEQLSGPATSLSVDDKRQEGGEVLPNIGPGVSGPSWTDMTPKTNVGDRYDD